MKKGNLTLLLCFVIASLISCTGKKAEGESANPEANTLSIKENAAGADTTQTVAAQATAPGEKPKGPLPAITFKETHYDFGTIKEGQKVAHRYTLTNTGEAPLVIQSARPSCGCTVSAWSKEPIPVGGTGFVAVEFDSKGRANVHNKTVTITANTWPKTSLLHFKVMVTPKTKTAS